MSPIGGALLLGREGCSRGDSLDRGAEGPLVCIDTFRRHFFQQSQAGLHLKGVDTAIIREKKTHHNVTLLSHCHQRSTRLSQYQIIATLSHCLISYPPSTHLARFLASTDESRIRDDIGAQPPIPHVTQQPHRSLPLPTAPQNASEGVVRPKVRRKPCLLHLVEQAVWKKYIQIAWGTGGEGGGAGGRGGACSFVARRCQLTTHPFRDRSPFLLLLNNRYTFNTGRS